MDLLFRGVFIMNVSGLNLDHVASMPFGFRQLKPENPEQWYNKNPTLFKAEVSLMRKKYPNAKLGFFRSTGNMYWIIVLQIVKGIKAWTFLLEYEKNHPNNDDYGGSIHVQLLKSPSLEELRQRAEQKGLQGVPHLVSRKRENGESYVFLCTRRREDVNDGVSKVTTAVQVAGWAADWALHFEIGLNNKSVWNKWCDDLQFEHLKVPE